MRIIELLMDNIFFVVAAMAFVSYVFNRLFRSEQSRGGQAMPPYGQPGGGWAGPGHTPKNHPAADRHSTDEQRIDVDRRYESDIQYDMQTYQTEPLIDTTMPSRRADTQVDVSEADHWSASEIGGEESTAAKEFAGVHNKANARIHPEDAAKGIVWAEVFGAPRALRPYRARGYRQ